VAPQDDEAYLTGRSAAYDARDDEPYDRDAPLEPHRGTLILVMGLLGILVCFICGIFAWVWGNADIRKMNAGLMDPAGRSTTDAGRVIGIISVVLATAGLFVVGLAMCVGLGTAAYQSAS